MNDIFARTARFLTRAELKHNAVYDYCLVEYINARTKVKIICKDHGIFEQIPHSHLIGKGCPKCGGLKQKQTMIERYGVEHALQSMELQGRVKQTNLERYGVVHHWQSKKVREKQKQTNLERYGAENPFASKDVKEKIKQTMVKRYGVEHPVQSKSIRNRIKQTMVERYGVEHALQSKQLKERQRETTLGRYGVEHFNQSHFTQTCLEKINDFLWLHKEYVIQKKTAQQIAVENNIDPTTVCNYLRRFNITIRHIKSYSCKSIQWLESLMEEEGIFIQHAENIEEYNIPGTRFHVDGYCKETNTVYEFYGDYFHGNPELFEAEEKCHPFNLEISAGDLYYGTLRREKFIRELGYNLVTIWESNFTLTA